MEFGTVKKRKIKINFNGSFITSDSGMLLLRKVDKKIGLTRKINKIIKDHRVNENVNMK